MLKPTPGDSQAEATQTIPAEQIGAWNASKRSSQGTTAEFMSLLSRLGWSADAILRLFPQEDVGDVLDALARLGRVLRRHPVLVERLAFYVDGLRRTEPDQRLDWLAALTDLRLHLSPSESTFEYLEEQRVTDALEQEMFAWVEREPPEADDPDRDSVAYTRSVVTFLEMASTLLAGDANVGLILSLLSRHGHLQSYYADVATPRATVLQMAEAGFDVDHLVFGRSEVLTAGASKEKPQSWSDHLMEILRRVLGTREEDPEVPVGPRPGKVYHELQDDIDLVREGSEEAALRVVDEVLPRLESRYEQLRLSGQLRKASQVEESVHNLRYLRAILSGDLERVTEPVRLRARRSPQHIPELFFDNVRFACCLFKPSGLFHREISRLLLDPATPMLEYWLDPYPQFLGLATLYAGIDALRRPTLLIDTVDYDDRLLELRGNRGTLRFMLNSLVIDAAMAGARRLAVFTAPYGKPVNFANFVKEQAESLDSATYRDRYYFESVDPFDTALSASRTGGRHYTVAFGYMKPLMGLVQYGHNLVKPGRVLPYPEGGEGVVEIDVADYLEEKKLEDEIPEPENPVSTVDDVVVWRPPEWQAEERTERQARVDTEGEERLQSIDASLSLEVHAPPSPELVDDLLEVDRAAFEPGLRYESEDIGERFLYRDAAVLLVRSSSQEPLAFALGYVTPTLGPNAYYLDDLAVVPSAQGASLGSCLLNHVSERAMRSGFQRLYTLARIDNEERLRSFYADAGFQAVRSLGSLGTLLVRSLHVCDVVDDREFDLLLDEAAQSVSDEVGEVNVRITSGIDSDIIALMQDLERVFPPKHRYSSAEFRVRLLRPDSYVVVVEAEDAPVAFAIAYADPTLPHHAIFLDTMSVVPSAQGKGIGKALFRLLQQIAALSHYTRAVFYCEDTDEAGLELVDFYEAQGAEHVDMVGSKNRMMTDLRVEELLDPVSASARGATESSTGDDVEDEPPSGQGSAADEESAPEGD